MERTRKPAPCVPSGACQLRSPARLLLCSGYALNGSKGIAMWTREQVEGVLDRVRPFLRANGSNVDLVSVDGDSAAVRLTRVWAGCPGPKGDVKPIVLDDHLRDVEINLIRWALMTAGGNKSKAAALLGIKRSTLGDRINRCRLGRLTAAVSEPRQAVMSNTGEASAP